MQSIALDKQKLQSKLHRSHETNIRLAKRRQTEIEQFHLENKQMQNEINNLRNELEKIKCQFGHVTNQNKCILEKNIKLCTMFIRMKDAKQRSNEKYLIYEKMCIDFSELIKQQAKLLKQITLNDEPTANNQTRIICDRTKLFEQIADLMDENLRLRKKLSLEQNENVKNCKCKQICVRKIREKLIDDIIDELGKLSQSECYAQRIWALNRNDELSSTNDDDNSCCNTSDEIVIYDRTTNIKSYRIHNRCRRSNSF